MNLNLFLKKAADFDRHVSEWFAQSGTLAKGDRIVRHLTKANRIIFKVVPEKCSRTETAFRHWQSLAVGLDPEDNLALPLRDLKLPIYDSCDIYQMVTLGILLRTPTQEYRSHYSMKKGQADALTIFVERVRRQMGGSIPPIGPKEREAVLAAGIRQNFREVDICFCGGISRPDTKGFDTEFPTVKSLTKATRTEVLDCLDRHRHNAGSIDWSKAEREALAAFERLFAKSGLSFKNS